MNEKYLIFDILDNKEIQKCNEVGLKRTDEHYGDAKSGDQRAQNSYGKKMKLETRPIETRYEEGRMGTFGEAIAFKTLGLKIIFQMGQYKGNKNPDIITKNYSVEARSSRSKMFIIRESDFKRQSNTMLFCVYGLNVKSINPQSTYGAGWILLSEAIGLIGNKPDVQKGNKDGAPYWYVPNKYLSEDFDKFREMCNGVQK